MILTLYELTPEMVAARFTGRLGRFLVWLACLVERAAVHCADHLIVVSEPCRSRLLARNVPGDRMSVVLNTTPWDRARPAPVRQHSISPVLITHTTLLERYGVHVAIEAVGLLKATWPDLTLRVVGGGEEHSRLVRLTHELRLDDRVIFTGQLPWSETLAEVSRATLGIVAILADGYGELLLPTQATGVCMAGDPSVPSWVEHAYERFQQLIPRILELARDVQLARDVRYVRVSGRNRRDIIEELQEQIRARERAKEAAPRAEVLTTSRTWRKPWTGVSCRATNVTDSKVLFGIGSTGQALEQVARVP